MGSPGTKPAPQWSAGTVPDPCDKEGGLALSRLPWIRVGKATIVGPLLTLPVFQMSGQHIILGLTTYLNENNPLYLLNAIENCSYILEGSKLRR